MAIRSRETSGSKRTADLGVEFPSPEWSMPEPGISCDTPIPRKRWQLAFR